MGWGFLFSKLLYMAGSPRFMARVFNSTVGVTELTPSPAPEQNTVEL